LACSLGERGNTTSKRSLTRNKPFHPDQGPDVHGFVRHRRQLQANEFGFAFYDKQVSDVGLYRHFADIFERVDAGLASLIIST
jgi:hypothetical protein